MEQKTFHTGADIDAWVAKQAEKQQLSGLLQLAQDKGLAALTKEQRELLEGYSKQQAAESGDQLPEQPKSSSGQYFGMSMKAVDEIVAAGGRAEEIMAYMVLSRGVNAKYGKRISTWGAKAISDYTGMSYRTAEAALDWLSVQAVARDAKPQEDMKPKRQHSRWALNDEPLDIYLANALVDGVGKGKNNPPLHRIYHNVGIGSTGLMSDARLDALMVMLHLYRHQDMVACGGVNPRAGIYRQWDAAENCMGQHKVDIDGTNSALYEIEGGNDVVFRKFADEALFYVPEDERVSRFWDALANVHSLGFCYEVTQVWSADPNKDSRAEPLYTLYVQDYHARQSEPYLQKDIHSAAFRVGMMDGYAEFNEQSDGEFSEIKSGRFRYVATKRAGGFPIGIYRMRFRPHTADSTMGIQLEQQRVKNWKDALKQVR